MIGSLRRRFFSTMGVITLAVMLVSFCFIDFSYRKQWRSTIEETLQLHVFSLLSVSQLTASGLSLPDISYNPKLNTTDSGLWAAVFNSQGDVLWHSLSISTDHIAAPLTGDVGTWSANEITVDQDQYLAMIYAVQLEIEGAPRIFHFVAAQERSALNQQIFKARMQLLLIFLAIAILLSISQLIGLALAFKPIARMEQEIAGLDEGKLTQLSGNYPPELNGVSSRLNALITKETQLRERYRENMADFAHSLKTPMAIIRNEGDASSTDLNNAIKRVDNAIEYQLRRAVISNHSLIKRGTDFTDILNQVLNAMKKIYQDKNIVVQTHIPQPVTFHGDENELMEILGNLLDNAFKYAHHTISISATTLSDSDDNTIHICIEDDGPGFHQDDTEAIFQRGTRLDNRGLGQGIGLAVVLDIVDQYQGTVRASRSRLGGAQFDLSIPTG